MANGDDLLVKSISIHPVFIVGLALLLMSTGALFGQTLFAAMASVTGISVIAGALLWMCLALLTLILGYFRSFSNGDSDAR